MKIPALISAELRRLTATRMSVVALIALMLVPVLYGGLYLWANQDPYGKFADIPVALVDLDAGAPASDGNGTVNYGSEVTDKLVEGRAFGWKDMNATEAQEALRTGQVDFSVTIPEDFSRALTSAAGDAPQQATLLLATNDANNYLASSIGSQAVERIRSSVAELVGREAASRLLTGIADIRVQLQNATDGANQLVDGAGQALDGANQLADGTGRLSSGAVQLRDGANQLAGGASQLADGTRTLAQGSSDLASGAAQVSDGTAELAGYADRVRAAVDDAAGQLPQVRTDIAALLADGGLDQAQIAEVLARLDPIGERLQSGATRVDEATGQIDRLAAGAAQVSSGAAQLASGAAQAADGAASVSSGAGQLASATDEAATGAAQLDEGARQLASGLGTLDGGLVTLRDGLSSGVAQLPDSTPELRDQQAQTIADPVAVDSGNLAKAGDYGAGLAPFFAALAGWIGIYALFLIVKPVSRRAVTALRSPLRVTLAGWLTPAMLGGIGMIVLFGVLSIALGFNFSSPVGTLGMLITASFTYAAIILALNVWLGSVGQFIGLVLMVLQLVTAGGTFPWQTLPAPLAALHHVLPMGYVVDGMRQWMYGGDLSRISLDLAMLFAWMAGALVLAAIGVARMTHGRTLRDLQPSLIG
ncbi:YhgE/Pip domain-containing protein [Microbacterium arborescens]|uniref:YhgE/Pip domain-containing protein n=1 Tax=Microbacterium arborescens TaxID=33883 RepID=UPI0027856C70|nr:YhgE/Pip domain-containing protein [Microbacterium arborescens]MDQ1217696.1 putative membrane protein [Microbacterium arborescens]